MRHWHATASALLLVFAVAAIDSDASRGNPKDATARKIFQKLEKSVFQIISAHNESAPKKSYGTAYIIDQAQGLLVTNFHVVDSAARKKGSRLFLLDRRSHQRTEVFIVAVNVVSDLAIVRSVLPLAGLQLDLRKTDLATGERTYSLGMPEDLTMSIIEGVYNGRKGFGAFEKYILSTPLNSGMSGGPTVDSNGRLVATNVSIIRDSNNISFAVPNFALLATLAELSSTKTHGAIRNPAMMSADGAVVDAPISKSRAAEPVLVREKELLDERWVAMAERQLFEYQDRLGNELLDAKTQRSMNTTHWRLPLNIAELNCWSNKLSNLSGTEDIENSCFLQDASPMDSSHQLGRVSFELHESDWTASKKKLSFENMQGYGFWKSDPEPHLYSAQHCNHSIVLNRQQQAFSVNYCMRKYRQFSKLYTLSMQLRSIDRGKSHFIHFSASLFGFSRENLARISRNLIENLEEKKL